MNRILTLFFLLIFSTSFSQSPPFDISIKGMSIEGLGGIQSYSFGQHQGKWLIVGGRLDGLHQRQPFAAFTESGNNIQVFVVDPIAKQKWTSSLSGLPVSIQEQLSSTNMEFYQKGDYLYLLGGYGYSATAGDHVTYNKLSAIDVPSAIDAIINGGDISPFFRQITDSKFQVTGGRLEMIGGNFYLVGGHNFMGRYNPMGPDHGPGFFQEYTDAIRVFTLQDDGINITINHVQEYSDQDNLHRRDFNVSSQILPDGSEGLTAFSGVFQPTVDLPFLNCVEINSSGYTVNNSFSQYYNHYHCGFVPLYSSVQNEMHTVFFGGIAQYYEEGGTLIQDDDVPFVNTIARVTRDGNGTMAEYKLPIEMPALLGAGSEFIPNPDLPAYPNGVLNLDSLNGDSILIGHIFGGIESSDKNIFFVNTGIQSNATGEIFEVFLTKDNGGVHLINDHSIGSLKLRVFPTPVGGPFVVKYNINTTTDVTISLFDLKGKQLEQKTLFNVQAGEHIFKKNIRKLGKGGMYIVKVETSYETATQKIMVHL